MSKIIKSKKWPKWINDYQVEKDETDIKAVERRMTVYEPLSFKLVDSSSRAYKKLSDRLNERKKRKD